MTSERGEPGAAGRAAIVNLGGGLSVASDQTQLFPGSSLPVSRHAGFDFALGQNGPETCGGAVTLSDRHHVVIVTAGQLELTAGGDRLELERGEVALVGPRTSLDWSAIANSRWIVNTYDDFAGAPGMRRVVAEMPLEPVPASAPELLLTAAPECRRAEIESASDGLWSCGIWQATAYARLPIIYEYYEMMLILDGDVTLATPSGHEKKFGTGDLFVVSPGGELGWRSDATVKKFWSIYRPAKPGG